MGDQFKLTQWDLVTFPGIAAAVVALVLGLKKLFDWTSGREPVIALVLTYALGITSKLTIKGSFANVNWLVFMVTLFMVAVFAKTSYDHLKDVLLGFGKNPTSKGGPTGITKAPGDSGGLPPQQQPPPSQSSQT